MIREMRAQRWIRSAAGLPPMPNPLTVGGRLWWALQWYKTYRRWRQSRLAATLGALHYLASRGQQRDPFHGLPR